MLWLVVAAHAQDREAVCPEGTPEACNKEAVRLFETGEKEAAMPLFRDACDGGNPEACDNLGIIARDGLVGEKDEAAARPSFQRACELGKLGSCNSYGVMLFDGRGGDYDQPGANRYFEMACPAEPWACHNVGKSYRGGLGTAIDRPRARGFFEQGCEAGLEASCDALSLSAEELEGAWKVELPPGTAATLLFQDGLVQAQRHHRRLGDEGQAVFCSVHLAAPATLSKDLVELPTTVEGHGGIAPVGGETEGCSMTLEAGAYAASRRWESDFTRLCDGDCRTDILLTTPGGEELHLVPISAEAVPLDEAAEVRR